MPPPPPPPALDLVARAGARAVAHFWEMLRFMVSGGAVPRGWADAVGSDHPFLAVVDGRLCLRGPAA